MKSISFSNAIILLIKIKPNISFFFFFNQRLKKRFQIWLKYFSNFFDIVWMEFFAWQKLTFDYVSFKNRFAYGYFCLFVYWFVTDNISKLFLYIFVGFIGFGKLSKRLCNLIHSFDFATVGIVVLTATDMHFRISINIGIQHSNMKQFSRHWAFYNIKCILYAFVCSLLLPTYTTAYFIPCISISKYVQMFLFACCLMPEFLFKVFVSMA